MNRKKLGVWIRWIVVVEAIILLLAVAGPGSRYSRIKEGDPALIARFFIEDPSFLQAVAVNEIVAHVVVGGAWLAAWIVGKRKDG